MKKTLVWLFVAMIYSGCGGDNAHDGENGLISGGSSDSTVVLLQQIEDAVLVAQSSSLAITAASTKAAIVALQDEQSVEELGSAQSLATTLFETWKGVEAHYVAKGLDDAMIDIPAQIDVFNIGNIDIPTRLDEIFAGSSPLEGQLYQSATRSMSALEYTLFGNQEMSDVNMTQRRADAAKIMIDHIEGHVTTIAEFYSEGSAFVDAGEDAVGIMINQMIDSTYKLKEWRIGDPAGYTLKYRDDPDAEHLEYYHSIRSLQAMRAILSAQESVMLQGLQGIAANNSASSEADALVILIKDAIAQIDSFSTPIEESPASSKTLGLYNTIDTIQTSYTALINALNFTQDIIEADGD